MNFAATIGNPPYNKDTLNTSDLPIYHNIMDVSFEVAPMSLLITKASFLTNSGKTPKSWNYKMLNDPHFTVCKRYEKSKDIFPNTDIKGGIAIFKHNIERNFGPVLAYTDFPELKGVLKKVQSKQQPSIADILILQNKFNLKKLSERISNIKSVIGSNGREKRLTTNIFSLKEIFLKQPSKNNAKILGLIKNIRTYRWIDRPS